MKYLNRVARVSPQSRESGSSLVLLKVLPNTSDTDEEASFTFFKGLPNRSETEEEAELAPPEILLGMRKLVLMIFPLSNSSASLPSSSWFRCCWPMGEKKLPKLEVKELRIDSKPMASLLLSVPEGIITRRGNRLGKDTLKTATAGRMVGWLLWWQWLVVVVHLKTTFRGRLGCVRCRVGLSIQIRFGIGSQDSWRGGRRTTPETPRSAGVS